MKMGCEHDQEEDLEVLKEATELKEHYSEEDLEEEEENSPGTAFVVDAAN